MRSRKLYPEALNPISVPTTPIFVSLAQTSFLSFLPCSQSLTTISNSTHPKPALHLLLFPCQPMVLSNTQVLQPLPPVPHPIHESILTVPPRKLISTATAASISTTTIAHPPSALTWITELSPSWSSCCPPRLQSLYQIYTPHSSQSILLQE